MCPKSSILSFQSPLTFCSKLDLHQNQIKSCCFGIHIHNADLGPGAIASLACTKKL
jgi:hypothetical protein